MSNLVIATTLADAATITASHEVANMTGANLKTMPLSSTWRSNTLTGVSLEINLGASEGINLCALLGGNLSSTATVRWRFATSQANLIASPILDSGTTTALPYFRASSERPVLYFPASIVTAQWVRVDLNDSSNPDSFIEFGRLYISRAWQAAINVIEGWAVLPEDLSVREYSLNGTPYVESRPRVRRLSATLQFQSRSEAILGLGDIQRLQGIGRDVLVIMDPDGSTTMYDDVIYGLFENMTPRINEVIDLYQLSFEVTEIPTGKLLNLPYRAATGAISRTA